MSRLGRLDLSLDLDKDEYESRLLAAQDRLTALRLRLGGLTGSQGIGPGLLCLFEGWDASGKGGAIKRLVMPLDQRHVRVASFAAPSPDEKRHHFLHRFAWAIPGRGGFAVFDRSWYGRVLVERVEGFATKHEWTRAYESIRSFERGLVEEGLIVVKFWMHVSDEEQLKRFAAREKDPLKSWKLTDEDWRNRGKRDAYAEAVEDMLEETDRPKTPWTLVEGDSKRYARVKVVETVVAAIEERCRRDGFKLPRRR